MRKVAGTFVVLSVLIFATACSTSPQSPEPRTETTTSRTPAPAKDNVTEPSPSATSLPDVADDAALEEAVVVAEAAMGEFVNHDREYDAWWAALSPYLDPVALSDYAYTDPRMVPASQVSGSGLVSASQSGTQVTVLVPTDGGQYRVDLFRQAAGAAWLVNSMTPAER